MSKKRGRKQELEITQEVFEQVEKMAGLGSTHEEIADYYGVSKVTWHKYKKKFPDLLMRYKKGKSKIKVFVKSKLLESIKSGNLTAIIFYLKTQCGWSEKNSLEIENKIKSKNKIFTIDTMDAIEASKIYQSIMTGSYNNERNSSSK